MRALERDDPRAVGRYRLLARLGAGGMAVVYLARSPGRRAVAVKVMHADLAAEPLNRERFRREVWATRTAAGRYCPAVLDAGPDAAIPWLATEFLPAVALRDAVEEHGPLPVGAAYALAAGLAEALAAVHRTGIAHRDVKPANVLLTVDGPRLIDFGIAAGLGSPGIGPDGNPAGSWGFSSPEQWAGGPVDAAGDVYSFGATLTFACTGRRPAGGLDRITDPRLREAVARCLRPAPDVRPTVDDLLRDLASGAGTGWPPAAVRADIERRVSEAKNPPVALPVTRPVTRPDSVRRRSVVAGALALGLAGAAGATAVVLRHDGSGSARPLGAAASPSAPSATSAAANTRTVEIYAYGRTTVRTLTTVINGQAETVQAPPLPYRRTVTVPATIQIPPVRGTLTWRVAFHCTRGNFQFVVNVDGVQVGGGGQSTTGPEMWDEETSED